MTIGTQNVPTGRPSRRRMPPLRRMPRRRTPLRPSRGLGRGVRTIIEQVLQSSASLPLKCRSSLQIRSWFLKWTPNPEWTPQRVTRRSWTGSRMRCCRWRVRLSAPPPTRDFSHTQSKGCDFEIGLCSSSHAKEQQCSSSEIANPRFTESGRSSDP